MTDLWVEKFKEGAMPLLIKEFQPKKVLLFGSRVLGTAKETSDLDLLLVSPFFDNIPFIKRMPIVLKKIRFAKHIDVLCYSPEEFQNIRYSSLIVIDALKTGEWLL